MRTQHQPNAAMQETTPARFPTIAQRRMFAYGTGTPTQHQPNAAMQETTPAPDGLAPEEKAPRSFFRPYDLGLFLYFMLFSSPLFVGLNILRGIECNFFSGMFLLCRISVYSALFVLGFAYLRTISGKQRYPFKFLQTAVDNWNSRF